MKPQLLLNLHVREVLAVVVFQSLFCGTAHQLILKLVPQIILNKVTEVKFLKAIIKLIGRLRVFLQFFTLFC